MLKKKSQYKCQEYYYTNLIMIQQVSAISHHKETINNKTIKYECYSYVYTFIIYCFLMIADEQNL